MKLRQIPNYETLKISRSAARQARELIRKGQRCERRKICRAGDFEAVCDALEKEGFFVDSGEAVEDSRLGAAVIFTYKSNDANRDAKIRGILRKEYQLEIWSN